MSVDNVADIEPFVQYTATASQTAFTYPFPIFADGDIVVYDNETLQVLTTDYTVSGEGNDTGGTVTFTSGRTAGHVITIYRDVAMERTTDFAQNGPRRSADINDELDRMTMYMQQLKRDVGRTVRIAITNAQDGDDLVLDSAFEGMYLYVNEDGELEPAAAINVTTLTQAIISALLFPLSDAESSAGVTPDSFVYPVGDPRRSSWYTSQGWIDLGDVPTRVSGTDFTVPGDKTARYTKYTRLQLSGATNYYAKVASSSYSSGTGLTTIVTQAPPWGGTIPTDLARVSVSLAAVTNEENSFVGNQNALFSQWFINQSAGTSVVTGLTIGDTLGTALAIRVTGTNYSGTFLAAGGVSGKSVNIHTGTQTPIVIGVNDYARMVYPVDTDPVRVLGSSGKLFRLLSPGSTGDCYMDFYRSNNTTRKGYLGFDSAANNNFSINNDETGNIVITTAGGNISFNPSSATLTFLNLKIQQGTGAPEGVVTAEVGSLYLRTDGGATTTLYVKTSGSGNTGWTAK